MGEHHPERDCWCQPTLVATGTQDVVVVHRDLPAEHQDPVGRTVAILTALADIDANAG